MCLQDLDKVRQRVVEQICSTAAIRSVPASSKLLILKFLAMHAYFAVDKSAVGKVWHVAGLLLYFCTFAFCISVYAGPIAVINASFSDLQTIPVQQCRLCWQVQCRVLTGTPQIVGL